MQKEWVKYEKVQADIFDHVMAMLDLFDLRAYQRDGHLSLLAQREHSVFNITDGKDAQQRTCDSTPLKMTNTPR